MRRVELSVSCIFFLVLLRRRWIELKYPLKGVDNDTLRIYINPTQYFDKAPRVAWEFYIGGYQPAPKWLKDRKDKKLQFEDILHYQKIITTLTHTHHLMQEIKKINIEE